MSVINEVKQKIDLVELISEYVPMEKAGHNLRALCPFHSEKHPSFYVFPQQQTWHCFGACGTGGDIFSFIMKKEGIDFGQALRLLAQRAGVTLSPSKISTRTEDAEKEKLFQLNEAAAQYYHHLLLNTVVGKAAREYLDKRKVTLETIKWFHLGFSPDNWDALKNYLIGKGYEGRDLVEVGLLVEREGGNSYDRFRNRLIFPICDIQGRITGFGARALDDSLPKYINSPQTSMFDKGSSLYGIDRAKTAIRERNSVIIVEGYIDVIITHQYGWQNVVASMGTSLTEKQVDIIKRLTKNISLALDADAAGEEAVLRGAEVLTRSLDKKVVPMPMWSGLVKYENILDAEIRVVTLPREKDPDEVIAESPTLWQKLIEQAPSIPDFAFEAVISKLDISKAKDKSLALQKLIPLVYEIKDPIRQTHYIQNLARLLKISESIVISNLRKLQAPKKRYYTTEVQSHPIQQSVSHPVEEYCLALLLQHPNLLPLAQGLSAEHFEYTENREIFAFWQYFPNVSTIRGKLDTSLLEHLDYLLSKPIIRENDKTVQRELSMCILRLQENLSRKLEAEKEVLLRIERERGGTSAELAKLEEEGISSSQQLHEIFAAKVQKKAKGD